MNQLRLLSFLFPVILLGWSSSFVHGATTTVSSYSNQLQHVYGHPLISGTTFHSPSISKLGDGGGANYNTTSPYNIASSSSGSYGTSVPQSLLSSGFEGRGDVGGGGFGGGGFGGSGGGWGGGGGGGGGGVEAALPVIYKYQLIPNGGGGGHGGGGGGGWGPIYYAEDDDDFEFDKGLLGLLGLKGLKGLKGLLGLLLLLKKFGLLPLLPFLLLLKLPLLALLLLPLLLLLLFIPIPVITPGRQLSRSIQELFQESLDTLAGTFSQDINHIVDKIRGKQRFLTEGRHLNDNQLLGKDISATFAPAPIIPSLISSSKLSTSESSTDHSNVVPQNGTTTKNSASKRIKTYITVNSNSLPKSSAKKNLDTLKPSSSSSV